MRPSKAVELQPPQLLSCEKTKQEAVCCCLMQQQGGICVACFRSLAYLSGHCCFLTSYFKAKTFTAVRTALCSCSTVVEDCHSWAYRATTVNRAVTGAGAPVTLFRSEKPSCGNVTPCKRAHLTVRQEHCRLFVCLAPSLNTSRHV